jgi:hypothetical protein
MRSSNAVSFLIPLVDDETESISWFDCINVSIKFPADFTNFSLKEHICAFGESAQLNRFINHIGSYLFVATRAAS